MDRNTLRQMALDAGYKWLFTCDDEKYWTPTDVKFPDAGLRGEQYHDLRGAELPTGKPIFWGYHGDLPREVTR